MTIYRLQIKEIMKRAGLNPADFIKAELTESGLHIKVTQPNFGLKRKIMQEISKTKDIKKALNEALDDTIGNY
ncbi:MAG: hypothetical protein UU72_C0053G0004 [candidate division WWE3 bacterium GW2011_GWB1_41_6]|uniref:Uncharacterized protein n=1 Tax=candidate division WWE3 bacterium GW2011_GWB1_41_6 TaxID=1619112 RepID=A0A0G0WN01_UNCKA|nr:MAG: hypothetical protein UU72_C0053G0004 [candidate division WWE3 bacterium GW2011_GWB1_41_6]